MIKSMTGFGKSEMQNDELILSLELRSINSRFLDFSPHLPRILSPFEDDALKIIKEKCIRGRITLSVKLDFLNSGVNNLQLDSNRLDDYIKVIEDIQKHLNRSDVPTIGEILKLPEILNSDRKNDEKKLKKIFIDALKKALVEADNTRILEGKNILKDLNLRIRIISDVINKIEKISNKGKEESFQKYRKKIFSLLDDVEKDENRIYQEIAIITEKKDISEEIIRFNSHIDLFKQFMNSSSNEGKKLNFLIQELNREVNTIGSKTDIVEISHLVVKIKDELEKIREQVQNII